MRTQINIFVIVILASCLTYSCTDVLDVEPQGALVEGVEVDAQIMDKLITSVYAGLTSRFIIQRWRWDSRSSTYPPM